MPKKYYAVRKGGQTGIFTNWSDCKKNVDGYKGAVFKSFLTKEEAVAFLQADRSNTETESKNVDKKKSYTLKSGELCIGNCVENCGSANAIHKQLCSENHETSTCNADNKKEDLYHESEDQIYEQIKDDDVMIAYIDGSYDHKTRSFAYAGVCFTKAGKTSFAQKSDDPSVSSMRNVAGEVNAAMHVMSLALSQKIKDLHIYYDYAGIELWADGSWKTNNHLTQSYKKYVESIKKDLTLHFHKVKSHTNIKFNEEADKLAKKVLNLKGSLSIGGG